MNLRTGSSLRMLVVLCIAALPSVAPADILVRGTMGSSGTPTGDVGDMIAGQGIDGGGELYVGLTEAIYLGGGVHLAFLGGREMLGQELTEHALLLTFDVGGLLLLRNSSPVTPFGGVSVGRGSLGWTWDQQIAPQIGEETDSVGFWLLAPRAGMAIELMSQVELFGSVRYVITQYDDETMENFIWDLDGGNVLQVMGGLGIFF